MELQTSRLILRDMEEEDVFSLARYEADPRYLEHYHDRPQAHVIVNKAMDWARERPRFRYQLAVTEKPGGRAIGCVGIRKPVLDADQGELGCEINPDYWNRGYATEACRALLAFAARKTRLIRVTARTTAANQRAHRLLESLGFSQEGEAAGETVFMLNMEEQK